LPRNEKSGVTHTNRPSERERGANRKEIEMTKKKLTGEQIAKNILAVARWDKSGALAINSQECAQAIRYLQAKVRKLEKGKK
jgi:hypothetical protein